MKITCAKLVGGGPGAKTVTYDILRAETAMQYTLCHNYQTSLHFTALGNNSVYYNYYAVAKGGGGVTLTKKCTVAHEVYSFLLVFLMHLKHFVWLTMRFYSRGYLTFL